MTKFIFAGLLPIFLIASVPALSQSPNRSARVVFSSGEEKEMVLSWKDVEKTPSVIETPDGRAMGPKEVEAFELGKLKFVAATVDLDLSPIKTADLTRDKNPVLAHDTTLFLQVLVEGPRSLFSHRDQNGKDHLFIRSESYQELTFRRYLKPTENLARSVETFRDQLTFYLDATCPDLEEQIRRTRYTAGGIQKAFRLYYTCVQDTADFEFEPDRIAVEYGVLGGITQQNLTVRGSLYFEVYEQGEYSSSQNPTFGAFINLVHPRYRRRWSFYTDLSYTESRYTAVTPPRIDVIGLDQEEHLTFQFNYLRLAHQLRYRFPIAGPVQGYIGLGLSHAYAVKNLHERVQIDYFPSGTRIQTEPLFQRVKISEQGVQGSLGISFWRISLEGRYERTDGFSPVNAFGTFVERMTGLVSLRF